MPGAIGELPRKKKLDIIVFNLLFNLIKLKYRVYKGYFLSGSFMDKLTKIELS